MHRDLQMVFKEVVKYFDCTIVEGYRGKVRQERLFREGKSKARWRESKHNKRYRGRRRSEAGDVVPYPIDWNDTNRMRYFAGFVVATANSLGVRLRWGGDWNRDTEVKDNRFNDLPHFELF